MARVSSLPVTRAGRLPWPAAILLLAAVSALSAVSAGAQTAADAIAQIKKPGGGNDAAARLEVRRLTNYSFRPGSESERQAQETALLAGLAKPVDWEIKAFLIEELRFCGKSASVDPLAAYLTDANLCEPAAQSLLGIASTEGPDKIIPAVRAALPSSQDKCRPTLMRAAGSLRDGSESTLASLTPSATSTDRNIRAIALRSLANIGSPLGKTAIAQAMNASDRLESMQAMALNLLFAERLAERGLKAEATEVANAVRSAAVTAVRPNVVLHADSTLAFIKSLPTAVPGGGTAPPSGRFVFSRVGGRLRLDWPGAGPWRVRIADMGGRTRREWRGDGSAAIGWDAKALPSGIYRIVAERAGGARSAAFVNP